MNSSRNPQSGITLRAKGARRDAFYRILLIHYSEETMWNVEQKFLTESNREPGGAGICRGAGNARRGTRGKVRQRGRNFAKAPMISIR